MWFTRISSQRRCTFHLFGLHDNRLLTSATPRTSKNALLVYEAARRSVMEDVNILQGLAAAQAQTTGTQLRVLREARSESKEVAQEAARQTALEIANYIDQKIPKGETSGGPTIADRMLGPMADMAGKQIGKHVRQDVWGKPPADATSS